MRLRRRRFEPQGNPYHAISKNAEGDAYKAIDEAISKYGVPDNIYVDSDAYYEALIQGKIPAKTAYEMLIQKWTKTDAGLVLAVIGLEHSASAMVYRYLADQKYEKINPRAVFFRGMIDAHRRPAHNTLQKVTRRGIKVDGKEYWNDDLLCGYLGKTVNVVIVSDKIRVEDLNRNLITTFTVESH